MLTYKLRLKSVEIVIWKVQIPWEFLKFPYLTVKVSKSHHVATTLAAVPLPILNFLSTSFNKMNEFNTKSRKKSKKSNHEV